MNTNKVNQQDETGPLATAVHIAALASHGDAISHELEEAIFQYVAIVGSKQRLDIAFNKIAATEPTGVPDEVLETWKIESGFAVLDARTDEIYEQVKDLEVKICEMPCLSIGDIAAKVGFVTRYLQSEPDPDYEDKYVKALNSMAFLPEGHGAVASLFERVAKVATDDVPVAHHGSHAKSTRDDEAVSENLARFVEILEYFKSLLVECHSKLTRFRQKLSLRIDPCESFSLAATSEGQWSDRHGIIKRYSPLGPERQSAHSRDFETNGFVAQYD